MSKKVAVFPASFDPVTNGHVDLIDRVCNLSLFDSLIVAIGINPAKTPRFTLQEQIEMLEAVIQPYPNVAIDKFSGLTAQYAQERGACTIIRGLREFSDFEKEFQMARMNRQIAPGVDTLFMMANTNYAHLSSTLVMEILQIGGLKVREDKLLEMVPPVVLEILKRKVEQ